MGNQYKQWEFHQENLLIDIVAEADIIDKNDNEMVSNAEAWLQPCVQFRDEMSAWRLEAGDKRRAAPRMYRGWVAAWAEGGRATRVAGASL
jgi:hypothetical protein